MSFKYRLKIAKSVVECLKRKANVEISEENVLSKIIVDKQLFENRCSLVLTLQEGTDLGTQCKHLIGHEDEVLESVMEFRKKDDEDDNFYLRFLLKEEEEGFRKGVLEDDYERPRTLYADYSKKVVVEYSSPNIAKPFHFGHLRSTIIGNFAANVNKLVGNAAISVNYLGDWGTQFGLLQMGLQMKETSEEEIRSNPTKTLYEAYVFANKLAETNADVETSAKGIFREMEQSGPSEGDLFRKWRQYREFTVEEFTRIYDRLGIRFDEYDWESEYRVGNIRRVLERMKAKKGLLKKEDGALVADLFDSNVPILKRDGTSLYLTRDVAAAISRYEKHSFHRMLYVVDSSQMKHFAHLFELLRKMDAPCADKLQHVRFGRVIGLSTRKGNVVFLRDILEEIKRRMERNQIEAFTTRGEIGGRTADILGMSAVIINDLKRPRKQDYEFQWDFALKAEGDTGVRLQYAHCRLNSMERKCGAVLPLECDPTCLREPEAVALINQISRFGDVIESSYAMLEARVLTYYLFSLCNAINKAIKALQVKDQPRELASQRLLLFHKSRQVLNCGMKTLGLIPLKEM